MLSRIISFATSRPKRVIAMWAVIALALTSVPALFGYRVITDDTAQFLPRGSESARAMEYARTAFGQQKRTQTVSMMVKRQNRGALTAGDRAEVRSLAGALPRWRVDTDRVALKNQLGDLRTRAGSIVRSQAGPLAPDGRFQLVGLQWKGNTTDPVAQEFFRQVRDRAATVARGHRLEVGFTGGVASRADEVKAQQGKQALAQLLLLGSVMLLSLLFFRGPLAAIVPLLAIYLVAGAASGLVVLAALAFGFTLDVSTPQLITVVLIGIGVDYFLFLLFRLRERLRLGEDRRTAARQAANRVGPVIASAALAIVSAFATMLLAEFGQFRVIGPAVAISVLVMLAAGLTLMPAISAVTGRALFWPSRSWAHEHENGPAARLGRRIARAPGRVALAVIAMLIILSTFALGTTMSYDQGGGGPSTPATRTADEIAAALSKGAGDPQQVYVRSSADRLTAAQLEPLHRRLARTEGISAVGTPVLTPDRHGARLDVALKDGPLTKAAMRTVRGPLRHAARDAAPARTTALVGGTAAIYADVSDSVNRDMKLIFPIAAGLILLILVGTLRSALAPLYLLTAVVLEFAATLGAAVLVFQQIGGEKGVSFVLPLVLFLFVVALGTDYNILMTARLREETLAGKPVRTAVAEAVRRVAPAIAAAGLVLASSFGTLMLEPGEASRQQGFAMAFGILLASLVVSSMLVPALTAVLSASESVEARSPRVDRLRLRDSTQLLVRPITPDDKSSLASAYAALSADSRWLRFSTHAPTLSERDLAYLTEVDHHTHEALVAVDPSTEAFVGVARYIAIPGSDGEAEVAVAVDDSWQGRGVATGIMRRLAGRARAEGVRRFIAVVSEDNPRVIGMLERSGALRRPSAGQRTYLLELSALEARSVQQHAEGEVRAAAA